MQTEDWTSPEKGNIHVAIPGKPGEMTGTALAHRGPRRHHRDRQPHGQGQHPPRRRQDRGPDRRPAGQGPPRRAQDRRHLAGWRPLRISADRGILVGRTSLTGGFWLLVRRRPGGSGCSYFADRVVDARPGPLTGRSMHGRNASCGWRRPGGRRTACLSARSACSGVHWSCPVGVLLPPELPGRRTPANQNPPLGVLRPTRTPLSAGSGQPESPSRRTSGRRTRCRRGRSSTSAPSSATPQPSGPQRDQPVDLRRPGRRRRRGRSAAG